MLSKSHIHCDSGYFRLFFKSIFLVIPLTLVLLVKKAFISYLKISENSHTGFVVKAI